MVSSIFNFHPYLGKIPILANIFQLGWNHQPANIFRNPGQFGWKISSWLAVDMLPENRPKRRFGSPRAFSIVRWGQGIVFFSGQTKIVSFKGWKMMKQTNLWGFWHLGAKMISTLVLPKDWEGMSIYIWKISHPGNLAWQCKTNQIWRCISN